MKRTFSLILMAASSIVWQAVACTNFIVTKGASTDGSTMISYAADSHTLYGEMYHFPRAKYAKGTMLKIKEWDTGKPLGEIPQASETYNVIGNINEYAVSIGETTFTGREELQDTNGIVDYGSLIYIALQRSKTAREAINIMTSLVKDYGYYSTGESFSIADPNEAWIMEMIGKGPGNKGALWVAKRIPDGSICSHANQARITTIDFNDSENCLYAPDVIEFARAKKYFSGTDAEFSFSDTYAPLDFSAIRFSEARVWSFFNTFTDRGNEFLPYILCRSKTRMPLYVKPNRKISAQDLQNMMRDHFDGTPLDMTKDPGAGPYSLPYRWRPLTWKVDSNTYFNERAIATQQTGFSFISQLRPDLPTAIGGIIWFGVDDAATSVYVPFYCGTTQVPECFRVGNGDMLTYSPTSAFWVFNKVSNMAYTRYSDILPDILKVQTKLESAFAANAKSYDMDALKLYKRSPKKFEKYANNLSKQLAQNMFAEWNSLSEFLLIKYIDGNIKAEKDGKFLYNGYGLPDHPHQPGYSNAFYRAIIEATGDRLKFQGAGH